LDEYLKAENTWEQELRDYAEGKTPIKLDRSNEYASSIIRGLLLGETFKFYGNVANTSLITNLPDRACVEVPTIADKGGFHPMYVGDLPPQCATLNYVNTMVVELTVEAALAGDTMAAYRACCLDPVAAAACSLEEIKQMVDELFKVQAPLLKQFKV
jgi:alpha-galactosidase